MPGMDRRRGKGRPPGGGPPRPGGRRTPPPDNTGLESGYFEQTVRSGAPIVLELTDGSSIRGVVVEFDRDQLTLERDDGSVVVRKSEIRYLAEE